MQIFKAIFGTKNDRTVRAIRPLVDKINSLESGFASLSDDELKAWTPKLKEKLANGSSLDDILPEAFAVCREASKRVLGMRHYDVQMIGGIFLHRGSIAEMRTGEGKTLVATLPVYLNALSGLGAHVVTVNDYLAKRDAEWMGRLYKFLGLTVGIIVHELSDNQRKESYRADITYATNNELGFDYLRDNMKFALEDYVQRPLNFAIVDECDSILIDEARTPLIISGPAESSTDRYYQVNKIIPSLKKDVHFTMEEKSKTASLTDEGNALAEKLLGVENLYDPQNIELLHLVYQGLKAQHLYKRDVDYMIANGEIVIVDEFTGRLMPGRRWSDGLHQAIEAKEGVVVKNENQTLATITFQNFFRMYKKMSGMTGTADTEAVEFKKIYNLDVVIIPTHRSIRRIDHDDIVFKNELGKFNAIISDIKTRYEKKQPVLVGTVSIEKSEQLSKALQKANIPHEVLNAKHHEREAEIIAQAGRSSKITIATNMAGRGTDIVLGGNPETLAKKVVGDETAPEYQEVFQKFKVECDADKKIVLEAGGLYIIGTERHESRRIDNQLRGRSGRQGDPGESRFYLGLDDGLMRIFNGEMIQKIMDRLNVPDDEPIMARMVSRSIEGAQRKVENHNFDIRKHLIEYDDVMNQQRSIVYQRRRQLLEGTSFGDVIKEYLADTLSSILDTYIPEGSKSESWNLEALNQALMRQFAIRIDFESATTNLDVEQILKACQEAVKHAYQVQCDNLGEYLSQTQKFLLLQSYDHRWKEHLARIDKLKEGINLRGYAQKDPLIEYKKEAFTMFSGLLDQIKVDTIEKLMRIRIDSAENLDEGFEEMEARAGNLNKLNYSGPSDVVEPTITKGGSGSSAPSGSTSKANSNGANQKVRMVAGPPQDAPKMNRSDRRKMDKRK